MWERKAFLCLFRVSLSPTLRYQSNVDCSPRRLCCIHLLVFPLFQENMMTTIHRQHLSLIKNRFEAFFLLFPPIVVIGSGGALKSCGLR